MFSVWFYSVFQLRFKLVRTWTITNLLHFLLFQGFPFLSKQAFDHTHLKASMCACFCHGKNFILFVCFRVILWFFSLISIQDLTFSTQNSMKLQNSLPERYQNAFFVWIRNFRVFNKVIWSWDLFPCHPYCMNFFKIWISSSVFVCSLNCSFFSSVIGKFSTIMQTWSDISFSKSSGLSLEYLRDSASAVRSLFPGLYFTLR